MVTVSSTAKLQLIIEILLPLKAKSYETKYNVMIEICHFHRIYNTSIHDSDF